MQQPTGTMSASGTAGNTSTSVPYVVFSGNNEQSFQACSKNNCNAAKHLERAKPKCSQFVTAPYIVHKPILFGGNLSVFQVSGEQGKVGDINSQSGAAGGDASKPIFRIKPGTHAHVINYVLLDESSDTNEQSKAAEQEGIRVLLDSQRQCATDKLQKLVTSHRSVASKAAAIQRPATVSVANLSQLYPNLAIARVEGATETIAPASVDAGSGNRSSITVDQLQAEIQDLRRTVARLEKDTQQ